MRELHAILLGAAFAACLALCGCSVGVATYKGTFDLNAPVQQVDRGMAGSDGTDGDDP